MACERHVGFQPAVSRPVSPNEGRLCPLADGAGECEARASSNAGEEIDEEAAEIPAVRPQAVPAGPSENERLEHLPLHEPYRSWCATCVAGRAVSDRHIWQPPPEGALAIVGLDYGYLAPRGEPEERCTPILFGKDSRHKWFYAIPMPSKGITEPWCAQAVASSVSRAGFGRLSFRSDTEPAIVALKRAAGHILTTKFGTEIVPEEASMGDSSSNGLAEHAVREVKAKARSLAHGLKRLLGQELEPTHPVVTWLIQWAAMTINIGRRGIDGKTPWEGFQQESIRVTSRRGTCRECFWALHCTVMTLWSVKQMDLLVWHGHSVDFQSHSVWMRCYFEECVEYPGVPTRRSVLKSRWQWHLHPLCVKWSYHRSTASGST